MTTRIQLRRDTAANWAAENPILAPGEPGVDLTNGAIRVGDGGTRWNDLPSQNDASVALNVSTPGSATNTALNSAYAPITVLDRAPIGNTLSPFSEPSIGPGVNIGTYNSATNFYLAKDGSGLFTDRACAGPNFTLPAGYVVDQLTLKRACVVRFNSVFYLTGHTADGRWHVWKTSGTVSAPLTWTLAHDFTDGGDLNSVGTSFPTAMEASGSSYLFLAEYNDPAPATLWRTSNGTTWTAIWTDATIRHIHAVWVDPDNAGHVYMTTGDGSSAARLMKSTDNGASWTTLFTGAEWQAVQISGSTNYLWLAPDYDFQSVIVVDRAAPTAPKVASHESHTNIAVPGGAPSDLFYSKAFFGAYDADTGKYYFVATSSNTFGNRSGVFMFDPATGKMTLLSPLPVDAVVGKVRFLGTGAARSLYCGDWLVNIGATAFATLPITP